MSKNKPSHTTENQPFRGTVWEALQQCPNNQSDAIQLWQQTAFLAAVKSTENAKKSMATLKKHLPKKFHPFIRFAQPKNIWYLNVEKGVTAAQLNRLLDDLSLRIAKDIGYAPKIKVAVHPTQWQNSGFSLTHFDVIKQSLPNDEEADEIIASLVATDFSHNDTP